jgi:hypothetical protein
LRNFACEASRPALAAHPDSDILVLARSLRKARSAAILFTFRRHAPLEKFIPRTIITDMNGAYRGYWRFYFTGFVPGAAEIA